MIDDRRWLVFPVFSMLVAVLLGVGGILGGCNSTPNAQSRYPADNGIIPAFTNSTNAVHFGARL